MATRLAFVDDPSRLPEVPAGFTVVALDPFVAIAAPNALQLDEHLDDLEVEEIGEQTHERVGAICEALDTTLRRRAGAPSISAHWRFQELKTVYDGMLIQALGATRLAAALAVDEAILLVRPESLAARVLPSALAGSGVRTGGARGDAAPPLPARPPALGQRLAATRTRARRAFRRHHPRVLCVDEQYSLPAITAALRERGAETLLWLPPPRRPAPPHVADLAGLESLFRFAEVDLWPAVQTHLRRLLELELPADEAALGAARAAIRWDRPDVLLASTFAAPAAKAAATAGRAAGIPSVVARHGELAIRALPVMVFNDLDVVDWALCWGEWEARFVARYAPRPVRTAVVGAPMIEAASERAPRRAEIRKELGLGGDEVVTLLAPTALNGDEWFIGKRAPTDLGYVRHQIALVEQLLSVDGLRLVVKEHASGEGPLEAWARATGSSTSFVHGRQFAELIHAADAIVLDFPSTTLVQALLGSSRLYVVRHPVTSWEPGVLDYLDRHGVRTVPAAELGAVLRVDVASGWIGGEVAYPPEVREPLLASGPGTAAERAADAVLRIASGTG